MMRPCYRPLQRGSLLHKWDTGNQKNLKVAQPSDQREHGIEFIRRQHTAPNQQRKSTQGKETENQKKLKVAQPSDQREHGIEDLADCGGTSYLLDALRPRHYGNCGDCGGTNYLLDALRPRRLWRLWTN